jgi:hypothetical protein
MSRFSLSAPLTRGERAALASRGLVLLFLSAKKEGAQVKVVQGHG